MRKISTFLTFCVSVWEMTNREVSAVEVTLLSLQCWLWEKQADKVVVVVIDLIVLTNRQRPSSAHIQ
eukprot:scaffold3776_cov166-Ochromonas_danica.AAC.7